ncbi:Hypothetical predicted protein [Marmota monax]|uniref:Uncharacterized protein n=1 Tax=Marmota monax TaxID=9995 RepID=A0A5E4CCZ1_MARMO|nr:hypothetical protein GHT09_007841 [Marmota monax]VTJ79698.1 Hypothetical predicted protein [Marmota monax]
MQLDQDQREVQICQVPQEKSGGTLRKNNSAAPPNRVVFDHILYDCGNQYESEFIQSLLSSSSPSSSSLSSG